jgi:ribosomal protein S18 acetylase RimI-like enzyme
MTSTALARAKDTARRPGLRRGLAAGIEVVAGTAGDHPAVQQFLGSVLPELSGADFQSQLDEPTYEPSDRWLIKHGQRVAAHLRLTARNIRFGVATLPISYVAGLAVLPEFRGRGYASALLDAAERAMRREGSVLGLLRASEPEFYQRRGWVVCGRHSYSAAGCHQVLAHLRPHEVPCVRPLAAASPAPLHIRYLRRVELAAAIRLHEQHMRHAYGGYARTEASWRWLINRRGYERIYVAIEGSPEIELDGTFSAIVGYAAAKNARLVELVSAPSRPDAATRLLARFCSDAIEQDLRDIRVELAPDHPLHATMLAAGGAYRRPDVERGQAFMVKVLDPGRLVQALHPEFLVRLQADKRFAHRELGFVVGGQPWILEITPHSSRLSAARVRRTYLRCGGPQFVQLLLGHLDVRQAVADGLVAVSNQLALDAACTLLPPLPLWYPPLDDLPAR